MFTLSKPSELEIIELLCSQASADFSYSEVGASLDRPPEGYNVDHQRVLLGYGEETFQSGVAAIQYWKMFPSEMTELCWPDKPIEVGTVVAILARAVGLWTLNCCRIVYVVDDREEEHASVVRYGFAYGTLPAHVECGEERFLIEWNRETDEVHYDLLAFSKPQQLIAHLGYPVARLYQARFRNLSAKAMQAAVAESECLVSAWRSSANATSSM